MEIIQFKKEHISQCVDIAYESLNEAGEIFNFPIINDCKKKLTTIFTKMLGKRYNLVAINHHVVEGYLFAYKINQLFGTSAGAYISLENHGAINNDIKIYEYLYTEAAKLFVERKLFSNVITIYSHQKELIDFFTFGNFGYVCMDAIKKIAPVTFNCEYELREIKIKEANQLHQLANMTIRHLTASPLLLARSEYKDVAIMKKWLAGDDNKAFGAFDGERLISYIKTTNRGETFISEAETMDHICGTYTLGEYRNKGITKSLLSYVNNYCYDKGMTHLGVNFETFNLLGRKFWLKYFNCYTISLVRRIDERVR